MQILLHWRSLLVDCEYFVAQTFTSRHIAHAEENDAVQAAVSAVLQLTINWLATIISSQLLQHSLRHSLPTLMLTPRCLDTRQGKGHSHYWSSLGFSLDTLNWRRKKTWNSTTGSWQQRDFVGWHLLLGIFLFQISIQLLLLCWDENIIFCRDDTGPMSHTSQVSRSVQFYNLFYSRGLKEILYTTTN